MQRSHRVLALRVKYEAGDSDRAVLSTAYNLRVAQQLIDHAIAKKCSVVFTCRDGTPFTFDPGPAVTASVLWESDLESE